jgi:kojibiose phosphorylase
LDVKQDRGETISFEKVTAIYSSRDADHPLDAAQTKSAEGAQRGYAALAADQESAWAEFWSASDVELEGDDEAQLAIRHALFQLRIAAPTHDERVSIGAKTLSGFGYRGHVFWDNEIFVLPFFIYTQPGIARNLLKYRYHTLPGARRKANSNGYSGAQYPWESAESGDEVTPTWVPHFNEPTRLVRIWTGDIQIHISADIAYAMHQYWCATGDDDFWIEAGIPVLLETAVFWGERAEQEGHRFAIRDVIGPDENHDHVDNNQYTNYMLRWHLQTALDALDWLGERAPDRFSDLVSKLELNPQVLARWRSVIDGIILLHDPETGLIEQFEGFYKLKDIDWSALKGRTQSIQEILGIESCAEHKALKQADVIALLCLLGNQFDDKTHRANWNYYVPITDHEYGSSLGPSMHAWAACRLRMPQTAYEHFMRAARADLLDVRGNAGDGMHAASAGGLWEAVVFGFAGMRITEDGPQFDPCLPPHWKRLSFNIEYHRETHRVEINAEGQRTSTSLEV